MSSLLQVPPEVYKAVSKAFDRTEEALAEDVATVREWMKDQPHLPEVLEDEYIRNFLILNKCSIELAKQKIDMYYTARSLVPDIFQYSNATEQELRSILFAAPYVPVRKLTKDMYRVVVSNGSDNQDLLSHLEPYQQLALMFNVYEVRMKEDVMFGDIIISDMRTLTLKMLTRWTPAVLSKALFVYEKVFSSRLKALYLINSPSYIETLLGMLKAMMKPKLFQRIHVCSDSSILLKELSPEFVPSDYGGDEQSVLELQELWLKKLVQYKGRFEKLSNMKVKEELRPEKLKNDDLLGFHGNFKKLSVD